MSMKPTPPPPIKTNPAEQIPIIETCKYHNRGGGGGQRVTMRYRNNRRSKGLYNVHIYTVQYKAYSSECKIVGVC